MTTFLRLLTETFRALVSFILGISALAIICYMFVFISILNSSVYHPEPGKEVWDYVLANLHTGLQLLLVAAPIWLIAWLPFRLKQVYSASPWRVSTTIFVAAAVGAVGGMIEGPALVLYWDHIANTGQKAPLIVYMIYSICALIIGAMGGALIGAAEILTSTWFRRRSGNSFRMKTFLRFLPERLSARVFFILAISALAVICYIILLHSIRKDYTYPRPNLEKRDAGKLFHFQMVPKVPIPYIVLSPCPPISWIGFVREGSTITELLYEGGNGAVVNDPSLTYPGQITGTPTSTPFVPGVVSTVPITVAGINVGRMPGTGFYAEVQEHRLEIISDVYVGTINPLESNQGYIVRTGYPIAVVRYSYETRGGQLVLIDSKHIAAYAANGWKTDPLLGGGPRETIVYAPFPQ